MYPPPPPPPPPPTVGTLPGPGLFPAMKLTPMRPVSESGRIYKEMFRFTLFGTTYIFEFEKFW